MTDRVVNQLLTQLDGVENLDGYCFEIIFAFNCIQSLKQFSIINCYFTVVFIAIRLCSESASTPGYEWKFFTFFRYLSLTVM